jgi:NAD(P) transhydrogenase
MNDEHDFDLLVIGAGPAGQRAAVQAAKLGRRVAVIERPAMLGGVSTNTGTIPSKTLRAAVLDLTGLSQRSAFGDAYRVKGTITIEDLLWRAQRVIDREREVVRDQLRRNGIELVFGTGRFVDDHTVEVISDGGQMRLTGHVICIAVGTTPARPQGVEFDDRTVIDSDGILGLARVPRTMTVVGAGVVGIEYASIFAALGTRVTIVEKRQRLLDFIDGEISEALLYHLRDLRLVPRFGESVRAVERLDDGTAVTHLESGKHIPSETVLYAAGRQGATADLSLAAAGLEADARGHIAVSDDYRTAVGHIYAVGDVVGWPALAASSLEEGRIAALDAFTGRHHTLPKLIPIGVYTIPEISTVGESEETLTDSATPYVVGVARYRELARGQIAGDVQGLLKILVHPESRRLLGVHIFGTGATELVHLGQMVMTLDGTVDDLVDGVFNYPTFAEGYKVAALDAANRLNELQGAAEHGMAAEVTGSDGAV